MCLRVEFEFELELGDDVMGNLMSRVAVRQFRVAQLV